MAGSVEALERTIEEYKSDEKPTWCPGCGDFGVLNALYNALRTQGYAPEEVVTVSGIGCSSRLPYFMSTYGFHSLHGRAMPIATGLKVANPNLKVVAVGGDGDAFAIGAGHTVHALRRNVDLCYVIMDNSIYGLTKGQTSPTSQLGFTTKTTPRGNVDQPINPLLLALACGATFVARGFSGKPKELAELIVRGLNHKGFAIVDTYSPCPTFNKVNTFKFYREEVEDVPADHDVTNKVEAMRLAAMDDPLHVGVFYEVEVPSFVEHVESQQSGTEADRAKVLAELFKKYS
jgi:2-oxoglutarate ferredoxin oxidoreductase subunit beta